MNEREYSSWMRGICAKPENDDRLVGETHEMQQQWICDADEEDKV